VAIRRPRRRANQPSFAAKGTFLPRNPYPTTIHDAADLSRSQPLYSNRGIWYQRARRTWRIDVENNDSTPSTLLDLIPPLIEAQKGLAGHLGSSATAKAWQLGRPRHQVEHILRCLQRCLYDEAAMEGDIWDDELTELDNPLEAFTRPLANACMHLNPEKVYQQPHVNMVHLKNRDYAQIDLLATKGHRSLRISAHRFMCWAFYGPPVSLDMVAMHQCGNPSCINPRHLAWGTQRENCQGRRRRQMT